MKKVFLALVVLLAVSPPAHAEQQCYTPLQFKAEQWLRLHSELMVITVTCKQSSLGDNLVPFYTGFTKRHLPVLHEAEQVLIKHYKALYGGSGVDKLDELRTRLGNEYGEEIAQQSAPMFCTLWRDKVIQMYGASPRQVEVEVESLMHTGTPYEHMCDGDAATLASKGG
jgi:hypothetical protein